MMGIYSSVAAVYDRRNRVEQTVGAVYDRTNCFGPDSVRS